MTVRQILHNLHLKCFKKCRSTEFTEANKLAWLHCRPTSEMITGRSRQLHLVKFMLRCDSISWYAFCWNFIQCCLQWKSYTKKNLGGPLIMAHRVYYCLKGVVMSIYVRHVLHLLKSPVLAEYLCRCQCQWRHRCKGLWLLFQLRG